MPELKNIQFITKIKELTHLAGIHYLEIPKKVVAQLGGKFNMRLFCTVNNQLTFQGGLVALGNGSAYISINCKRMKQIGVKTGSIVTLSLVPDKTAYGMEVPEELKELLNQDTEGMRRFKLLPPGKQRYIIHYVATVKSTSKRIDRAILLIENLKKLAIGKECFREMLGLGKRKT